jgi:hypothetical protein
MPPLTQVTVEDKVRKRLGLPEAELPTPNLDEAFEAALVEFSKHRPNRTFGTLPITAQVIDYPFPSPLEEILDFFYAPQTILGNLSFEEEVLVAIQGNVINIDFGGNIFENPTLVTVWFQKMKDFRENIGLPPWRVLEDPINGMTLRLGQIPSEDGTAYWEGKIPWTLAQIFPKDYECFEKACLWKASEWRANRLAVVKSYSDAGIRTEPATDYWEKRAANYKQEFLMDVGYYRGSLAVG